MSAEGAVQLEVNGGIASVTFDRPEARNAMTWAMYERLRAVCEHLREDRSVRVVRLQGAGGEAFVAGTDIAQFQDFDGERGVQYERNITPPCSCWPACPCPPSRWCRAGA